MKDVYLVNYSVRGIKTLDQMISLSFYKKTISNDPDTQRYNMKGIYGMNGSGKSGIITSVNILKNLLVNPDYLNNPIVQKNLNALINKKSEELFIEVEYMADVEQRLELFRYNVKLARGISGKYIIIYEKLSSKRAVSQKDSMDTIFCVENGELVNAREDNEFFNTVQKKTANLLSTATLCALFYEKILGDVKKEQMNDFSAGLVVLLTFGKKLHVYLDQEDDHRSFLLYRSLQYADDWGNDTSDMDNLIEYVTKMDRDSLAIISVPGNIITKAAYERFEGVVHKLCEFLQIFKPDLQEIEIEKKEDRDIYVCNLNMVYDTYKIHAEYESTGIKKLIRLFAYLREMVRGGIVFIDEFDSNLHDVYLCALLEYLMEYGEGQLCFTTHNVGPMDILKRNKKSIDFLSIDHKIYPWTTNGNYSPSRLYRNGMIEGSPFNVDSIDFIGVFGPEEEEN